MFKVFLICFLSASLSLLSQVNTSSLANSSWTSVQSKMMDGSRDLSPESFRSLVWKFNGNKLCENIHPWALAANKCGNVKIENDLIKTADKRVYQIEKLTADSLVVVEKWEIKMTPDKIKRMRFVSTANMIRDFVSHQKSDSVVISSVNVIPALKKDLVSDIQNILNKKNTDYDIMLEGQIFIFPKAQKVEITTDGKKLNSKNQANADLFKKTLQESFKAWDLTGFEQFEKIIIPYRFLSKQEEGFGTFSFSPKILLKETSGILPVIKNKYTSTDNFNKGYKAVENQKFDNAIYFFNQAFEYDNTNVDALYNVVSISLSQNKTNVACAALTKLKELEQTEGMKLYKEKCLAK